LGALDEITEVLPSYQEVGKESFLNIYLDITDLIEYAQHNTSLSGIQRVISSLAKFSASASSEESARRVRLVIPDYDKLVVYVVNISLVCSLIQFLEDSGSDRQIIDNTLRAVYESRSAVDLERKDLFIIAGAFWICNHYDLISLLRARGVQFGVFIHDLIQIKHPELVHEGANRIFRKSLIDVLMLANFVLTSSHFVAAECQKFLTETLRISPPVRAIPLATEFRDGAKRKGRVAPEIVDATRDEFVLCVCTIEVRKNHIYLLRIW
jgi:hypothetical protein